MQLPPDLSELFVAAPSLATVKGDANYRRCLDDRDYTPFKEVTFKDVTSSFPCTLVALRALKSEVGVEFDEEPG